MNALDLLLLGLFLGTILAGVGFVLYLFYSLIRELIDEIRRLTSVLTPIMESGELVKGFRAFQLFGSQLEPLGRTIEALDNTVKALFQRAFVSQPDVPTSPFSSGESGVFPYNEEEAASRNAATENRKKGIETEESRVSVSPSETTPAKDVF